MCNNNLKRCLVQFIKDWENSDALVTMGALKFLAESINNILCRVEELEEKGKKHSKFIDEQESI